MIFPISIIILLCKIIIWDFEKVNSFDFRSNQSNNFIKSSNIAYNSLKSNKCVHKKYEIQRKLGNRLHLSYFNKAKDNKNGLSDYKIKEQLKHVVKDIQGVWKFYFPVFIMDTEFEKPKEHESNENSKLNNSQDSDGLDDFQTSGRKNEENHDDSNLNVLRGERLHPLPLFVYNVQEIYSASNASYGYWSNEHIHKNIYECTIKIINKMNSKYMIILQGYLFVSEINAINDTSIFLRPCQIFGNLFLAKNDAVDENSLIPPNVKVCDKNGIEVKDIISILEKKIPEFRKDKKKIEAFLGLKKWKFLGASTAYKVLGEDKNIFNINHMLTGKDENTFYNVMSFDIMNNNYDKQGFMYLKDIFNSYFSKPSDEILSMIVKNLQEKSISGPF